MLNWLTSKFRKTRGKRTTYLSHNATEQELKRPKIVVIEDNLAILKMITSILEQKERFSVITAANGKEGLELIMREKPDLVVSDIMMPQLDGLSLLERLRKYSATKSLPVILLTAKARDKDIQEGYRKGADYYITKPFTKGDLLRGVNLMLADSSGDLPKVWKVD